MNVQYGGGHNTVHVGNGVHDYVYAAQSAYGAFTFGDGAEDAIEFYQGNHNTVHLGNGANDFVSSSGSYDTIILGNGDSDRFDAQGSHDSITLGNGNGDVVYDQYGSFNTIKLGSGDDTVHVGFSDTITVGKGADTFIFDQTTPGSIGNVTINFDPAHDVIQIQCGDSRWRWHSHAGGRPCIRRKSE